MMTLRFAGLLCLALGSAGAGQAFALEPCVPVDPASVVQPGSEALDAGQILTAPEGTPEEARVGVISSRVRNLVVTDPGRLEALAPLLQQATGESASGLGIGLGTAAQICARRNPLAAQEIQKAVLMADNTAVSDVFAGVIGDEAVLSVGDAPSGPVGGETNVGGGPHRGTVDMVYGFRSGAISSGTPNFIAFRARSSDNAFASVSGFR